MEPIPHCTEQEAEAQAGHELFKSHSHSLFLSPPSSGHHTHTERTSVNGKDRRMPPRPSPLGVMKVQCA